MRSFYVAALLAILAGGTLMTCRAHAGEDVLLPTDNTSQGAPNLGLMPSDPDAAPQATTPQTTVPQAMLPSEMEPSPSAAMPPYTPIPQATAPIPQLQGNMTQDMKEKIFATIPPEVREKIAEAEAQAEAQGRQPTPTFQLSPGAQEKMDQAMAQAQKQAQAYAMPASGTPAAPSTPTQVVNLPDPSTLPKGSTDLPNSIDVNITAVEWSPQNVKLVTDKLNIKDSQVPSACRISVSGLIRTEKSTVAFDLGSAAHATENYDGKISSGMVMTRALCTASPPGPNKGLIFKMGDQYMVSLGTASCALTNPDKPVSFVSIAVANNGTSSCTIQ